MQVQKINTFSINNTNSIKKTKYNKTLAFKGYNELLARAVKQDLKDVADVTLVFEELLKELKSTYGVKINNELTTLEKNGFRHIHVFMEEITAPIKEVPPSLRDLVFKTEDESITLLEKEGVGSLEMYNFGKKGFFNSLFNSQDARNDIKFVFYAPNYKSFEVGITKKGELQVEQSNFPNWIKSTFGIINRSSKETGTCDTSTPIWPSF